MSDQWLEWIRQAGSWVGILGAGLALVGALATLLASNEKERRANVAAEIERSARQQLEQKIKPRALSGQDAAAMARDLSGLASVPGADTPRQVAVFPTSQSFESARLAEQLAGIFDAAGWMTNRHAVDYGKPLSVGGIGVLASAHELGAQGGDAVVRILRNYGLASFRLADREATEAPGGPGISFNASLSVFVGDKP